MYRRFEAAVTRLVTVSCLLGGVVLVALVLMTVASVAGRALPSFGLSPVPGDVELVELGMVVVICTALPWTQFTRSHASVDLLEPVFGRRINHALDILWSLVTMLVALLLAWRMWAGMIDKRSYQETTFILQIPLWYAYLLAVFGLTVFTLSTILSLWRSICAARNLESADPHRIGSGHV